MNKVRIVAAVVDTRQLTLYKEDGTTIIIPQGDHRLRLILVEASPQLQANKQADGTTWADVTIEAKEDNSYADFENQGSGLVKFFRVAKSKLKELLKPNVPAQPVPSTCIGQIPATPQSPAATASSATPPSVATAPVAEDTELEGEQDRRGLGLSDDGQDYPVPLADTPLDRADDPVRAEGTDDQAETFEPVVNPVQELVVTQTMSVVDEIIKHATPVSDPNFTEQGIVKQRAMAIDGETSNDHPDQSSQDTIIAVVGDKVIPGVELIKTQFARAANLGSTTGVENFLKRLGTVIESRSHSVEDLLKFMERADLPIADDGTILIYKVLNFAGGEKYGQKQYKDCHSGNVPQWIGAYVCMDPKLVDHNRNNECSNGLHVARRGYIRSFGGSVCVLAKLAPEDVITVPTYDANKMRVCGYHILKELTPAQYSLLKSNRPITEDAEGKRILAEAMCGNHIRKTHEVRIRGPKGGDILITPIPEQVEPAPILTPDAPEEVEALPETNEAGQVDAPVDPKAVEQEVKQGLSRKEQAQKLYEAWQNADTEHKESTLDMLVAFKKQAKVGWDRLGIPDPTAKAAPKVEAKEPAKRSKAAPVGFVQSMEVMKPPPVKKALPAASEGSPRERIAKLLAIGLDSAGVAQKVYDIKKASKKSWEVLGISDEQAQKILKAIGKITD